MKKHNTHSSFFITLLLIFVAKSTVARKITTQEVEDEREFDYSREGEKGPERWGELKEEWAICKNGMMQSPIDLSNERVEIIQVPDHRGNYKPSKAIVANRGHDIMVKWVGDAGSVFMNGVEYILQQAHWHSPSEHTVNGRRYAVELHMLHASNDINVKNNMAVFGVLYDIGQPDAFLDKLMKNISSMIDHESEVSLKTLDPEEVRISSKSYHRYLGSLTVPPCTEGVIWTINEEIRTISVDQVKLLRKAVHDYAARNARPLQAFNNREVYLYGPEENSN